MFRLAWRQLFVDPLRTGLTALALGAVIAAVLVLEGFEQGQYYQLARTVAQRGADLFVTQSGVSNLLAARSSLPQLSRADVEAVEGVASAHPLTALPVIYRQGHKMTPMYVFVYDTRGGAVNVYKGRDISKGKEIVIDVSLAKKHDIKVGDTIQISDFAFTVSGITRNEAAFFVPLAYINYDGMLDFFLESEIAPDLSTFPLLSFMLVELAPGADRDRVAAAIDKQVPEVDVFTPEQMAANDVRLGKSFFGPVMRLLIVVTYVIGLLVVSLIMYASVRARLHSFAVLKALGFTHRHLVMAVLLQALMVLAVALPVGVLAGQGIAQGINVTTPLYLVHFLDPVILGRTLLASIGFALLGALTPLRAIRRADPMLAFQGA
jgi:ABC-type antimicrobial peptide transport system permease subunit